ncbi:hypothetical protein KPH14_009182 [Odynerus spinipes]|uniref:Uncharacterized protein n=1 Tax=Odynerus spinipes TaxID=1348599 RepID=A0AAD9VQN1_9HYME|nr:hypothetical protein KPH14_009182 [Odynerus spinipes]
MSCSVKISSGKSWSGSQRRISSLAEENTCSSASSSSSSSSSSGSSGCALLQTIQANNNVLIASTISSSTAFLGNTIAATAAITTATTTTTIGGGGVSAVSASLAAGVFPAGATATGGFGQRIQPPRPVKSIAAKKGEDTSKLLKYIDDNVIGKNGTFFGPFGRRKGQ